MDAGSFVIALLTAAGAAAGPPALGALPDATAPTRCIAAPEEERFGSARPGTDVGLGTGQDTDTGSSALPEELVEELTDIITRAGVESATRQDTAAGSSALAEELAQELADVVAESDDPTSQRLAAALAAAGFEASATGRSRQETAASRSDDGGRADRSGRAGEDRLGDDRVGQDRVGQDRVGGDDQLDRGRRDDDQSRRTGDDRLEDNRLDDNRLDDNRLDQDADQQGCGARGRQQDAETGADNEDRASTAGGGRSSALDDVLSSQAAERERPGSDRSGSAAGRGGSGIAEALERGERAAG